MIAENRTAWICWDTHEVLEYTDEEWIEIFGGIPSDRCLVCGRHKSNRHCGWWELIPIGVET